MNRILIAFVGIVIMSANVSVSYAQQPQKTSPSVSRQSLRIVTGGTVGTNANLLSTSATLQTNATLKALSSQIASPLDSAAQAKQRADEARATAKADSVLRARSGIDTIVTFAAQDSITYSVKGRKMRLRSNAYVKNEGQTLSAEIIELFFEQGYMRAANARDSSGRVIGIPKFVDKGETFYGAELSYNFRTKRGTISLAETKLGEGFFFGEKVKRIDESTFFLKDGCYTTCDKTHPHFYFKAPRMKVIAQDRIFADPLIIYFSDIPVFAIPFGLFVENKTGRRSGILIPQVFFASAIGSTTGRGIAFENLGYYWAINDNLDAQLTGSFYTKGGWLSNFKGRYAFGRRLSGNLDLSYGIGGFSATAPATENWRIGWQHSWEITPMTRVSGSINLSSDGYNQQTQLNIQQRSQQTINSQFSISHTFDNGLPLSLNYSRVQNVATGQIDNSLSGGTNIPQVFPVRDLARAIPALSTLIPPDSWLTDIAFTYAVNARATLVKPADSVAGETLVAGDLRRSQASNPFAARISHSPSINIAPKLGYFVLQPSISYNENWYFRRITSRTPVSSNGTVSFQDKTENGFFREYNMNAGISLGTTLYGIANPHILGINSLRHTVRPSIGISYQPNLQNDQNLAGRYTDTTGSWARNGQGQEVVYSRYVLDGGSTPLPLQANLNWSIGNNFEAKIQQDTAEKVVQLMQVNIGGSVNLAAETFKWSPIGVSFSNTFADVIQFSGSANFSIYDQELDPLSSGETRRLVQVNRSLIEAGKGLARLTNMNFNLAYRLAGNTRDSKLQGGLQASGSAAPKDTANQKQAQSEEAGMGARFQQRLDNSYDQVDVFGENTPGFLPFGLEWSTDINGTFSYTPSSIPNGPAALSALLSANLNLVIEKTWRFTTAFNVDVISGQVNSPTLSLQKDLHCWDLSFRWQPFGTTQGYFFRVGIKTGQLRDVQLTRQDNKFYR